jgi:hypothetical protein
MKEHKVMLTKAQLAKRLKCSRVELGLYCVWLVYDIAE